MLARTRDDGGGGDLNSLRSAADASRARAGFRNDRDPTTPEEERYWSALGKSRLQSKVRVNGILTRTRADMAPEENPRTDVVIRRLKQIFAGQKWFGGAFGSDRSPSYDGQPHVTVMINSTMPAPPGQSDYEKADLALPLSIDGVEIGLMHHDVGLPRGGVVRYDEHGGSYTSVAPEKLSALRARDALASSPAGAVLQGATIEKAAPGAPPTVRVKVASVEDAKQIPDVVWGISIAVDLVAAVIPVAAVLVAGTQAGAVTTFTKVDENGAVWTVTEMGTNSFSARGERYSPPGTVYGSTVEEIDKKIRAYAAAHFDDLSEFSSIGTYVDENNGIWLVTDRWKKAIEAGGYPPKLPAGKRYLAVTSRYKKLGSSDPDTSLQADDEMALKKAIDAFALAHKSSLSTMTPPATPPAKPKPVGTIPGGKTEEDTGVSDSGAEEDTSVSDSKPETANEAKLPPPSATVAAAIRAAAAVIDRSPWAKRVTPAGRQELLAVGLLENLYGTQPDWYFTTPEGKHQPSYNWGATVARKGDLFVMHGDKNADGTSTSRKFAAFRTQDDGFARFWNIFAKPDTLESANEGNATDTAAAMYGHGYFQGSSGSATERIERYAKAIKGASDVVAGVLGEPKRVSYEGTPVLVKKSGGGGALLLGGAAIVGLGVVAIKALA